MARHGILHRQAAERYASDDNQTLPLPRYERVVDDRDPGGTYYGWPTSFRPDDDSVTEQQPGWGRVSAWATIGLILSLVGLCATLTGLLAPEGLVLGAIGFLVSIGGLAAASRPGVTGQGLAIFGALCALATVGLAIAAMTGRFWWPNSRTDEISRWHSWLVAHWSWLARW